MSVCVYVCVLVSTECSAELNKNGGVMFLVWLKTRSTVTNASQWKFCALVGHELFPNTSKAAALIRQLQLQ